MYQYIDLPYFFSPYYKFVPKTGNDIIKIIEMCKKTSKNNQSMSFKLFLKMSFNFIFFLLKNIFIVFIQPLQEQFYQNYAFCPDNPEKIVSECGNNVIKNILINKNYTIIFRLPVYMITQC